LACLTDISVILEDHVGYDIVLGGDMNTNLYDVSPGTNLIRKFICDFRLTICNDVFPTNSDYTYHHDSLNNKSYVDYFIVSSSLCSHIVNHSVLDEELNFSDHLPISLNVCLNLVANASSGLCYTKGVSNDSKPASSKSFRWDHCNLALYYDATYTLLLPVLNELNGIYYETLSNSWYHNAGVEYSEYSHFDPKLPLAKSSAIQLIENLYSNITSGLYHAALQTIPRVKSGCLRFWWDQELNCFKDKAMLSNTRWIAAGKPCSGPLFDEKKKDKYAYRNCIRSKKKYETK
jgi:hypothetical protein